MNKAEKTELIRLDKIHAGKGEGAGASTETAGPTDAAVAHAGDMFDDTDTCTGNLLGFGAYDANRIIDKNILNVGRRPAPKAASCALSGSNP
eukprot:12471135-Heterocapsa_arctica.AAC.1